MVLDGTFGGGVGLILLDDVHCEGTEASLLDCRHGIWGRTDCSHGEDVAVRCRGRSSQETNEVPAISPATGKQGGETEDVPRPPPQAAADIQHCHRTVGTSVQTPA